VTRPLRTVLRWIESGTRLEYAWVAFALLNLVAMGVITQMRLGEGWETVPFHFVYVSFTILYGLRAWRGKATLAGILFVTVTTGAMTAFGIARHRESLAEFTEVPLMSMMFLAMVYHVHRRQQAQAVAESLAAARSRDLERKSAFLSDASHELLTPITIGRGHLELLGRDPSASSAEVADTCSVVLGELGRMERVINRLLLLESADAAGPGALAAVDAGDLVTEVFHRWRGTADREWTLGSVASGTVMIDVDQVTLALDALVENAVQHTPEGGLIEIGSTAFAGGLRIRVRDGGNGIPEGDLVRVFDRFYRVDGARNRRHGGVGLGLAIVKAIAEAHGGDVSVRSRLGRGSSFEVRLPGLRSARDEPVPPAADGFDHGLGVKLAP
jgi:signal transduction histidine kinase